MKSSDPLLMAWSETFSQKGDASAIFATDGKILRTFREVEESAREFQATIDIFPEYSVVAIQIGNHEDWPSILIAALRKRLVILPLEQSISDQQRDAALEICQASGIVETTVRKIDNRGSPHWGREPPSLLKLTSGTTAAPRAIRFRSEQLLADCNQICETMGISDADLNFGVIPISHSYGFSNLLTPLIAL